MAKKYQIGLVLPDVLGLYGDSGNALVLRQRMRLRGIPAEIIPLRLDEKIPANLDIYTLGGAEDIAQKTAVKHLQKNPGLVEAIQAGTPVLAICAAIQILGHWYQTLDGNKYEGLGIADSVSRPLPERAIGELVVEANFEGEKFLISGFENHQGNTELANTDPFGKVVSGVGNGVNKVDGVHFQQVYATYLHGPVLARNPEFADYLIRQMTGLTELAPINIPEMALLRKQRLQAAKVI